MSNFQYPCYYDPNDRSSGFQHDRTSLRKTRKTPPQPLPQAFGPSDLFDTLLNGTADQRKDFIIFCANDLSSYPSTLLHTLVYIILLPFRMLRLALPIICAVISVGLFLGYAVHIRDLTEQYRGVVTLEGLLSVGPEMARSWLVEQFDMDAMPNLCALNGNVSFRCLFEGKHLR